MMKSAILFIVGVIARQAYGDAPDRIVGGNIAMDGQFKYQVSLEVNRFHTCGGSIINPTCIITAAHCVDDPKYNKGMVVVSGTSSPALRGERHKIKHFILHPGYTGKKEDGWKNDIAVLILEKPIIFNRFQGPAPLPTRDYATGEYRGIISGWGKTSLNSDSSGILKWLEVNVLSKEDCMNGHKNPPTTTKQVCTLEKIGKGACQGDSGGPLVVNNELCGVVSWVLPCALGVSDVFTNVYYYLDFIEECQRMS